MSDKGKFQIGLFSPNLVNICVDQNLSGEMSGRIYHCYDEDPWRFSNIVELLRNMELLFDSISFPQASTESRSFYKSDKAVKKDLKKVCEIDQVLQNRGTVGTFPTYVRYRQNSTWQGIVVWVEAEARQEFVSTLDFIKLLNNALSES